MSSLKQEAIGIIESLPDDCSMEDIQYHLYVYEKVARGLQAVEEGRVISQDEAESKVREWNGICQPWSP